MIRLFLFTSSTIDVPFKTVEANKCVFLLNLLEEIIRAQRARARDTRASEMTRMKNVITSTMMFRVFVLAVVVSVVSALAKNVLIIQNKGGGHGEIGFSLAKTLLAGQHKVTILQDTCDKATQPFSSYHQLKGVSIVDTKLKDLEQLKTFLGSGKYDAVVDNNSKSTEAATCIANAVKSYGAGSQYVYISSGGMYKGKSAASGFKEADGETKDDNECRMLEAFLETQDIAWASMRPQYIYGDHTNKRINVDWFVDRIVRDRTIPMPG